MQTVIAIVNYLEQPQVRQYYTDDAEFGADYPCSGRGRNDGTSRSHWHRSVVVQGEPETRVRRHYKEPSDPMLVVYRSTTPVDIT